MTPATTNIQHTDGGREDAPEGTPAKSSVGAPPGPPGPPPGGSAVGHRGDGETLARPPDSALGPPGQAVMPWAVPAQLGLDGRAYALPALPALPETPPGSSPHLGPLHGVSGEQLDLWSRMEVAALYLRCRCPGRDRCPGRESCGNACPLHEAHRAAVKNGTCLNRCAKCGRTPIEKDADIPLLGNERDTFRFTKVVICDHWTCPSCGTHTARDVASSIDAAIAAWLRNNDGYREEEAPYDVWLFTPTVTHYIDTPMDTLIAGLYEAWERFAQSYAFRQWGKKVGLRARTRVFDVEFGGPNGMHPHFHIALFVDGVPGFRHGAALARHHRGSKKNAFEIPPALRAAWKGAVRAAGLEIRNEAAFDKRALQLQGGDEAAAYFVKWGLSNETGATLLKRGGPMALLDAAGAGNNLAGEHYRVFCQAVSGRQVVTGLADTLSMVGVSEADIEARRKERQAKLDAENPPVLVTPLGLVVRRCLWKRALAVGRGEVIAEVRRARDAGEDPQAALDRFLFAALPRDGEPIRVPGKSSGPPDG